ncbi:hypothetical protein YK48G_23730 [Lentilactobacillus fungorum]|uniref:Uncharacterized protein n=1 Tax=Lentilactobacillus fungorum TaxID=2201250 RepID=A0ABQ3W2X7_9LACO|nr:hypothetical protein YK48G_23730 [Lentilactobacillus fungorum]
MIVIYIIIAILAALLGTLVQVGFKWHLLTLGGYFKFLALTGIICIILYFFNSWLL